MVEDNMQLWEQTLELESFIRHYQPEGYSEQIHKFCFVPYVTEDDYLIFKKGYEENNLEQSVKNRTRSALNGNTYRPFDTPYFIEAIKEYFFKLHPQKLD